MPTLQLAPLPRQIRGSDPAVLAEALHDGVNLAIWERELSPAVAGFVAALLAQGTPLAESLSVEIAADGSGCSLPTLAGGAAGLPGHAAFVADVAWLLDAYACLLDARRVGLRLRLLDRAMCPRFHIDRVPLRLVSTYAGPGSEWLGEGSMPRQRIGQAAAEPQRPELIHKMAAGHVALLKGERWVGNEHTAIVHRSPPVADGERRLLLTLDWLD
ncbi:DUF1826 domain-containing protein [Geopseudomonas guangdongensis]|uniref:DUF1826 domain-containing protein n=1 Tax=Geopseudomonas guangdongensis TaxID=1245526 RepID=A0A1H2FBC2_9GAMM|nr:DUF1826 domain-containing protein [Pseudomonas guangdongensis]SDU04563.1 Protein of unknown function [Pseudomonas guangdongensis]